MNLNFGNGFQNIGAKNFANMFANKGVGASSNIGAVGSNGGVKNASVVTQTLAKLTNTYDIKNQANTDENAIISSDMKAKIKGLEETEFSIQDSIAMLDIAQQALVQIDDTLDEMVDLVNIVHDGTITDEEDIANIQKKLEELTQNIADTYDNAMFDDYNVFEVILNDRNQSQSSNSVADIKAETQGLDGLPKSDILINGEEAKFTGESLEIDPDELEFLLSQKPSDIDVGEVSSRSHDDETNAENVGAIQPDFSLIPEDSSPGQNFVERLGLDTIDVTTKEGLEKSVETLKNAKAEVGEIATEILDMQKDLISIMNANRHSVDTSDENLQEYINELTEYVKKDIYSDPSLLLLAQETNKPEDVNRLTNDEESA